MTVSTIRGDAAVRLLDDALYAEEWASLLQSSTPATVFQGRQFARAWWRVYGSTHQLAIMQARDAEQRLTGQFILVRDDKHGDWEPIGRHQADYPAVLAADHSPPSVSLLLRRAHRELGLARMRLMYLPPGSPVGEYKAAPLAATIREQARPLRRFADAPAPSTRTKAKRSQLRKLGARVELIRGPVAVGAFLEQFIPLHDERQATQGYGTPFRDDPLKASFLLSMAEEGDLLQVATMRVEERIIAALIGVRNGSHVVLGLMAHAADLEDKSPAACLIHELRELYSGSTIDTLDLTPGGNYKDRFATTSDLAFSADLGWTIRAGCEIVARRELGGLVRRLRAWRDRPIVPTAPK